MTRKFLVTALFAMMWTITSCVFVDEQLLIAIEEARWVYLNIMQVPSYEIIKHPIETMEDGEGDCADMSALLIVRMRRRGVFAGQLVAYDVGADVAHMVVEIFGVTIDPTNKDIVVTIDGTEIGRYLWISWL